MKLIRNTGHDRVADLLQAVLVDGLRLDAVTPAISIYACEALQSGLSQAARCRFVLPADVSGLPLLGSPADRSARNRLQSRWRAGQIRDWLTTRAEIRLARGGVPPGALVVRDGASRPVQALLGSLGPTTDGLGLTPGNPLSLIQASETPEEALILSQ